MLYYFLYNKFELPMCFTDWSSPLHDCDGRDAGLSGDDQQETSNKVKMSLTLVITK